MVGLPTEFRASVDSYSGPLDLLLYLIKKDEVDIFDIPLSEVIAQYHIYLDVLKHIDPNACGEFLVMAAHLMEVKSKLLLPREELLDDEEYEDPRIELVRQLLEYKKFKERALLLEKQLASHSQRYERPALQVPAEEEDLTAPLPLGNVDVWDLLTAFHRIQIALGAREPHKVVLEERPVEEFMEEVVETLRVADEHRALFEDLFLNARTRTEAIGYFLAILELAKQYRLVVHQDPETQFIQVRLRSDEEMQRLQREESRPTPSAEEQLLAEGEVAAEEELEDETLEDESADETEPEEPIVDAGGLGARDTFHRDGEEGP